MTDTGVGMPLERIRSIFEPYTQSRLSDYRIHGGTGLGLSVMSILSKQMGGDIVVVSQEGVGSTFVAYLPVIIPNLPLAGSALLLSSSHPDHKRTSSLNLDSPTIQPSKLPQNAETQNSPISSPRPKLAKFDLPPHEAVILVVDDNSMNRRLLGQMLTHFNIEYRQACNGQEAIDAILSSRNMNAEKIEAPLYGLILMDMSMPVLGGVDATRILRQRHGCEIPIIALTANAIEVHREQATEAGCTEFITKPIMRDHLHQACQHYLLGVPRPVTRSQSSACLIESFQV